jgi:hypothetical protein
LNCVHMGEIIANHTFLNVFAIVAKIFQKPFRSLQASLNPATEFKNE